MRIGVNCYLWKREMGGASNYFRRLLDELSSNRPKHEIVLFYFPRNEKMLEWLDSPRSTINAVKLANQSEIRRYFKKLDVFFCPFGNLWPRPVPVPSVVTVHDIQECFFPHFFSEKELFFRKYNCCGSLRLADRIVTVSEFSKRNLVEKYGVNPQKVRVAWQNAEDSFFRPLRKGIELTLKLPPDGYVFYPANRWPHKNHERLLEALLYLRRNKKMKIDLVVTGYDTDEAFTLKMLVGKYGMEDQVRDFGYVSDEQLQFLYSKATLLIFPSLFEGFGRPLLEAMARECPVACSSAAALPEIGGDAAIYFDPASAERIAEAIERLWLNPALRQEMIQKGKMRVKEFSLRKMSKMHLDAFKGAIQSFSIGHLPSKLIYHNCSRLRLFVKYRRLLNRKEILENLLRLLQ